MIELEGNETGFECPHCKEKWYPRDWGTEYNDPIFGITTVRCPACEKDFNIKVSIQITSWA